MKPAIALVVASAMLAGCHFHIGSGEQITGSGKVKSEKRAADEFTRIRLNMPASVEVEVGKTQLVEISADDNILPKITSSVGSGELRLDLKNGSYTNSTIRVRIQVPSLEACEINGAGTINIVGLKGSEFRAKINGSGAVTAAGAVSSTDSNISGSGTIDLHGVKSDNADTHINGSGNILLNASKVVDAKINGSGSVEVAGGAQINESINGSGVVTKK
ncbi:MAG: DUF2807 domain-containing protein [Chthonomonas sp.]|nr:DUF2807 domain-containing protein [Chthonomonas sp.]